MSTRSILCVVVISFMLAGCVSETPFAGKLPSGTHLDMRGMLSLSSEGQLDLVLDEPCRTPTNEGLARGEDVCGASQFSEISVVATTPWGKKIRGTWIDAKHIRFFVDWRHDGIDLLAPDAPTLAARSWNVSGTQWTPNKREVRQILSLSAAGDDLDEAEDGLNQGGEHSNLEVRFEIDRGTLQAGGDTNIIVRIINHGSDVAQSVVATTRSSVDALHDQRLDFGSIGPGSEQVRQFHVKVPATETAPDTMVLLLVAEANRKTPQHFKRRLAIAAAKAALATQCSIVGKSAGPVEVDAGEAITLRCIVENTGTATAKVELNALLTGGVTARAPMRALRAGTHVPIDVQVAIPRDLPIDATAELLVTVQDRPSMSIAHAKLAIVRRPKLCTPGKLTRAQYKTKLAGLRSAVTNGVLTREQFDRYDVELLGCMSGPGIPRGRPTSAATPSP